MECQGLLTVRSMAQPAPQVPAIFKRPGRSAASAEKVSSQSYVQQIEQVQAFAGKDLLDECMSSHVTQQSARPDAMRVSTSRCLLQLIVLARVQGCNSF